MNRTWQKILEQAIARNLPIEHRMKFIDFFHGKKKNYWDLMNEEPFLYLLLSKYCPAFKADQTFLRHCRSVLSGDDDRYDCPIHGMQAGPDCPRC